MARSYADAFLADILGNPDDDTPRLVYADWLDEQGDTDRAEFIRAQIALAKGGLSPGRRAQLQRCEWTLLMQHGAEWKKPVRRLVQTCEFHRGFIGEVDVWAGRFLTCAGRLFRRAPVQHVRLSREVDPPPGRHFNLPVMAESRYLRRLRALDLTDNQLESQDVRALAVSPHLDGLTWLRLAYNRIGNAGARALAEAPILATLTYLDLRHNTISAPGARTLAEALRTLARTPGGFRLRRLDLSGNNLGAAGRSAFASSSLLRRLVHT